MGFLRAAHGASQLIEVLKDGCAYIHVFHVLPSKLNLGRIHKHLWELVIAAGVIQMGMGVHDTDGRISQRFHCLFQAAAAGAGVHQQGFPGADDQRGVCTQWI